jgi:hypothetical protein
VNERKLKELLTTLIRNQVQARAALLALATRVTVSKDVSDFALSQTGPDEKSWLAILDEAIPD